MYITLENIASFTHVNCLNDILIYRYLSPGFIFVLLFFSATASGPEEAN